jgi:hypothetical protein
VKANFSDVGAGNVVTEFFEMVIKEDKTRTYDGGQRVAIETPEGLKLNGQEPVCECGGYGLLQRPF